MNVRLCATFWRTWTLAFQPMSARTFWQLGHWFVCTTYSTTNDCCKIVDAKTSF